MKLTIQRVARVAAGLAFTAMLGFGAAQAVASPAARTADAIRACDGEACNEACLRNPWSGGGVCKDGNCICIIIE